MLADAPFSLPRNDTGGGVTRATVDDLILYFANNLHLLLVELDGGLQENFPGIVSTDSETIPGVPTRRHEGQKGEIVDALEECRKLVWRAKKMVASRMPAVK